MFHFVWLINVRLLLVLNHFLADRPALYQTALFVTDHVADLLTIATFGLLWFWPQARERQYLLLYAGQNLNWWDRWRVRLHNLLQRWTQSLSRDESRAQFLLLMLLGFSGYVLARLLAFEFDISRPFATWLPVRAGVPGAFEDLRVYGSFPSDRAVLLAALPVALWFWDRTLATVWLVAGVFLMMVRVAVGFHSPLDMLGGGAIGVLITAPPFVAFRRRRKLYRVLLTLARGFNLSAAPYCFLLYALVLLGGLEFAMHFKHVLEMLFTLRADILYRLRG